MWFPSCAFCFSVKHHTFTTLPGPPISEPWSQGHSLCYAPLKPLPGTDSRFPSSVPRD
ncbi:hypothetical protein ACRRTK_005040 [Alexandromys fortis]